MKRFDKTSKGIFELIYTSPLQPIKYLFLLTKTRSQTTLEAKKPGLAQVGATSKAQK